MSRGGNDKRNQNPYGSGPDPYGDAHSDADANASDPYGQYHHDRDDYYRDSYIREYYDGNRKRKRRKNRRRSVFSLVLVLTVFLVLFLLLVLFVLRNMEEEQELVREAETEQALIEQEITETACTEPDAEGYAAFAEVDPEARGNAGKDAQAEEDAGKAQAELTEMDVYTFLQGPRAWRSRVYWSGSWCNQILGEQEFSIFGCGLCCLANIYSSLTPYECSPVDMFYYARDNTDYSPSYGYGAIDWPYMRQTLKLTGINSGLHRKEKSYELFRDSIADGLCAIALVASAYDDTYWQNVDGHYVTIWLYDPEDETVLLGDSGNPEHNRARIPLRYVYDALKTSGRYQYLQVTDVDEEKNTWRHDGISERWRRPKYLSEIAQD